MSENNIKKENALERKLESLLNEAKKLKLNPTKILANEKYSTKEKIKLLNNLIDTQVSRLQKREKVKEITKEIKTKLKELNVLLANKGVSNTCVKIINHEIINVLSSFSLEYVDNIKKKMEEISFKIDKKIIIAKEINKLCEDADLIGVYLGKIIHRENVELEIILKELKEKLSTYDDTIEYKKLKKEVEEKINQLNKLTKNFILVNYDNEKIVSDFTFMDLNCVSLKEQKQKLKNISFIVEEKIKIAEKIENIRIQIINKIKNLNNNNLLSEQLLKILFNKNYLSDKERINDLSNLLFNISKDNKLEKYFITDKPIYSNIKNVYNNIDRSFLKKVYDNIKFNEKELIISDETKLLFDILKKFAHHGDNSEYSNEEIIKFILEKNDIINSDYTYNIFYETTNYSEVDLDEIIYKITGKHRN